MPNSIVLIHIKEKLTELIGEIDEHTSIMGDFQKPLSVTLYKQTKIWYKEDVNKAMNTQSNCYTHTHISTCIYTYT